MKLLLIGDLHLQYDASKPLAFRKWQEQMFYHVLKKIVEAAKKVDKVVFAGDMFDSTKLSKEVEYLSFLLDKIGEKMIVLDGNHEQLSGLKTKMYLNADVLRSMMEDHGVQVYEYDRIENILFCSHKFISKLETERKGEEILISHIRLGEQYGCEIDPNNMLRKFDKIFLGDIHTPSTLFSDQVVYTNSPIDTAFNAENEYLQRGGVILDTKTKEWNRVNFIKKDFRKIVLYFDSVLKFTPPKEDNNWYKCVIEDTSHNLKTLRGKEYPNVTFELKKVELARDARIKDISDEVISALKGKKTEDSFLDYGVARLVDSGRPELTERFKSCIAELEVS